MQREAPERGMSVSLENREPDRTRRRHGEKATHTASSAAAGEAAHLERALPRLRTLLEVPKHLVLRPAPARRSASRRTTSGRRNGTRGAEQNLAWAPGADL